MSQREVNRAKKQFRLLRGWKITFAPAGTDGKSRVTSFNVTRRTATVYGWGNGRISYDYYFHEMLHLALWEWLFTTKKGKKTLNERFSEREETLITDVCGQIRSFHR